MVSPNYLAELLELPLAERIQLAQDLWDSVSDAPEAFPLTDPQQQELDRRLEEYRANPTAGSDWETIKSRLFGQK